MKEIVGDDESGKIEFSVMILGGAAALKPKEGEEIEPKILTGATGNDALKTDVFWEDLNGFLNQRLKDEHAATRCITLFKKAVLDADKAGR